MSALCSPSASTVSSCLCPLLSTVAIPVPISENSIKEDFLSDLPSGLLIVSRGTHLGMSGGVLDTARPAALSSRVRRHCQPFLPVAVQTPAVGISMNLIMRVQIVFGPRLSLEVLEMLTIKNKAVFF